MKLDGISCIDHNKLTGNLKIEHSELLDLTCPPADFKLPNRVCFYRTTPEEIKQLISDLNEALYQMLMPKETDDNS
uniref:Uncharacterized protein n=2 Tax=viral metagenome TaxID=1070528 RepID=A0A6H1ZWL2_9ZZZZ